MCGFKSHLLHDESLDWSGLFLRLAIPFLIRYNGDKR